MTFGDPAFERILHQKIEALIAKEQHNLGVGSAKDSLYEYGRSVGRIAGLKDALRQLEEAHKQMVGDEKSIAADMARR